MEANESTPLAAAEQMFVQYSAQLAEAVDAVLVDWVCNCVKNRAASAGMSLDQSQLARSKDAGEQCQSELSAKMRALLQTDLDAQQGSPLSLLRSSTGYATAVLQSAGVPEVQRDEFEQRAFPEDIYGLAPASFSDVDERLRDPGLEWGAAKAHLHLLRRREAGQR
ncbi:unannotated protein [freshwater metagenome]|uniref:Unannotated protein n=1 Tax=freshwater metagenome TaxID=449393 RepID=A0A6J7S3Y4_9ZZZZ|nr:hypothetical protein [Actinomycetota bacterium]